MHLLTAILIPWITLVTKGYALDCYVCNSEIGLPALEPDCKSQSTGTCSEHHVCAAKTVKLEAKKMDFLQRKYCLKADQPCGSVNMGEIFYREECCSKSDDNEACNRDFPQPPDKLPANGLECYTCKDNNCTNVLQCTGDDYHCINGPVTIGKVVLTGKGCASENMCVDQPEATCCKENRCNGIDPTGDNSGLGLAGIVIGIVIVIVIVIAIAVYYLWKNRRSFTWSPWYMPVQKEDPSTK